MYLVKFEKHYWATIAWILSSPSFSVSNNFLTFKTSVFNLALVNGLVQKYYGIFGLAYG
jgi:hypothetical protein